MTISVFNVRTITDTQSTVKIWDCTKHRGANSIFNTRPVAIIPLTESRTVIKALYQGTNSLTPEELAELPGACPSIPGLETEITDLMEGFTVEVPEPISRTVNVILPEEDRRHIVDLKMKHTCLGLQGCPCTLCTFSAKDCIDPEKIQEGFPINRTMEQIEEAWEKYGDERTQWVPKPKRKAGDYDSGTTPRRGVSSKKITNFNLIYDIAVMHIKIHCMEYLAELLFRIIAGVKLWINPLISGGPRGYGVNEQGESIKGIIDARKADIKNFLNKEMHITLFEGNKQATGPMFKIFLKDKNREKLLPLIEDPEERKAYEYIHMGLCALTLVANSQRHEIDVDFYGTLAMEIYLKIVETFTWAQVPETIHGLLAHMTELIERNNNTGLGGWSEEGPERMQSSVVDLRKTRARKNDTYNNLKDVQHHAFQQSHGGFYLIEEMMMRQRQQRAKRDMPIGNPGLKELVKLCFVDRKAHDLEEEEDPTE